MKQEKTDLRGVKRGERTGGKPADVRSDRAAAASKRKKRAKAGPRLHLVAQPAGMQEQPLVPPTGVEPAHPPPEGGALSTELRGHARLGYQ